MSILARYPNHFYYEIKNDYQNAISAYKDDKNGSLCIGISEEQAVDSYNSEFACYITLGPNEAKSLRDYLNRMFPL